MSLGILGLILGALFGIWRAKKAGGNGADLAQYAIVFGMIFGIVGVIITLIIIRSS